MPVKVGIIDSGIAANFPVAQRLVLAEQSSADASSHGSAVASLVLSQAPRCVLLSAAVFDARLPTAAQLVAEAIHWCVAAGARVINLSLGLLEDRQILKQSCLDALSCGVLLIAAHPARGQPTYPAIYPGVLAVSGDIRCKEGDCSSLVPAHLFGASALPPQGFQGGGASFAAARITGLAAAFFADFKHATAADFWIYLQSVAAYHGRERKQA